MAKHRGISTSDINTSEDHLLFQEDATVNKMDNDPETEEVYAVDKAPVDTVDVGTSGATETEEVVVLPTQYLQTLPMPPMLLQQMVSTHSRRQPLQKMTKQKMFPL